MGSAFAGTWRTAPTRNTVIAVAAALFVVCCLLPVGYLLAAAGGAGDSRSALMLDARQRQLLMNTALLGIGTSLGATAVGAPLGFALARINLPWKTCLRLALALPALLPPYIMALAWTHLASSPEVAALMGGGAQSSDWAYSLPAAIGVLSLALFPFSMLMTEVAVRRVDGRLEEAALVVAPPGRILRRIIIPLVAPAVLAASLVIFVLAISEFGVPGLLRVRVYTTEVFTAFAALYDVSRAVILTVPLLLLCTAIAVAAGVSLGDPLVVGRRSAHLRAGVFDGWRRPAILATGVMCVLAVVMPLAILVGSTRGVRSWSSVLGGSGDAVVSSLSLAAVGATAVVAVAIPLGYWRARRTGYASRLMDIVLVVTFGLPGTIIGVGLIGVWNRPGPLGAVYGTDTMLVLGYLARFLPVAALVLAAVVRYVPVSHEEAASVSGAGWVRSMWRIVLPQMRLGVLATWVVVFILAFGELGVSILVAPPGASTLPIRVYTIIANTPPSQVAALALLQTGVVVMPLAALGVLLSLRKYP